MSNSCRIPIELLPKFLPKKKRGPLAAFYPAPGWRDAGSRSGGTLYSVGNSGYSWSSATLTDNSDALYLHFNFGRISPSFNNGRGYGFQLRCLQE